MALTGAELSTLEEISRRTADEDPDYARRLSAFGGYEGSALGMPTKWTLLPLILLVILLVAGVAAAAVYGDGGSHAANVPHSTLR